ncbi:MMPL family transporter [Streptomyces sp. TRM70308]|uniref:MMPL family transporter n=1 Tax=Streptomyces sp. TRM70308 TaxID=3131932 RepID=UPI003D00FEF7
MARSTPAQAHGDASGTDPPASSWLGGLGATMARRRWLALVLWVIVAATSAALYPHLQDSLTAPTYQVQGSESDRVQQQLNQDFTGLGTEQDALVFHAEDLTVRDAAYRQAMRRTLSALADEPNVKTVVPVTGASGTGRVSDDGHTAAALMAWSGSESALQEASPRLQTVAQDAAGDRIEVYLTGYSPLLAAVTEQESADVERAESIGIPIALVVLLLATGAVVAAGLPLLLAALGVLTAFGILGAVSFATDLDSFLQSIVTMIGLGVGIDYTLFVVSRFREELARLAPRAHPRSRPGPETVLTAVRVAMATSGKTVLLSGIVVVFSLAGLLVIDSRSFREPALGAMLVVACSLLATLTLLPALLGLLGHRVNTGRLPWQNRLLRRAAEAERGEGFWTTWAHGLMRRPVLITVLGAAALVFAAAPALGLRTGIDLETGPLQATPPGQGQQLLSEEFSPGAVAPTTVVYTSRDGRLDRTDQEAVARLTQQLRAREEVATVTSLATAGPQRPGSQQATGSQAADDPVRALLSDDGKSTLLRVELAIRTDSPEAADFVKDLRDHIGPGAVDDAPATLAVGGVSAQFVDMSAHVADNLPLVIGLVLAVSLVFLILVFRSLLLPLKAICMNILATGATFGLVVYVFQQGRLEDLFAFEATGTTPVVLPLLAFAILFGLSMDYEIFLVRRIQENWRATGDNDGAVAAGLQSTALPITAAAAIMVAVFGSFVTASMLEVKQIGFALAVAIALDATVVRLVLVPAVMRLAGRANWWLPRWLDKRLPRVDID